MEENFTLAASHAAEPQAGTVESSEPALVPETDTAASKDGSLQHEPEPEASDGGSEPEAEIEEGEGELIGGGAEVQPPKVSVTPKPSKPSIMERFARAHGFKKDGEERFYHSDGTWIARANGDVFPWEMRSAGGALVCHYWPKDHCLDHEPLQLGSELWGLLDKFPGEYALILADRDGNPKEVSGSSLNSMLKAKELVLFPATYRLVLTHDQ
jgi:hypothetical protein